MRIHHVFLFFVFVWYGNIHAKNFLLLTHLYNETHRQRAFEYIDCLEKNLKHPLITKVHVIYDTSLDNEGENIIRPYLESKNITMTNVQERPSFGFCFQLVNELYPGWEIILSNADIYFNKTLHTLEDYDLKDKFLALTRWEVTQANELNLFWLRDANGFFRLDYAETSQDVWIFETPIRKFRKDFFSLGTWNCDYVIGYFAREVGLTVLNPCLTIQSCHKHLSCKRNYTPGVVYDYEVSHGELMRIPFAIL